MPDDGERRMADADYVPSRAAPQTGGGTVSYDVPSTGRTVDGALLIGLIAAFVLVAAAMMWSWDKDWGGWGRPVVQLGRTSTMKSGSAANTLTPKTT